MFVSPDFAADLTKIDIDLTLLETDSELYFDIENIQNYLKFQEKMLHSPCE